MTRPTVVVNVDRAEVLAKARKALIDTNEQSPRTFIHGSVLVRIGRDDRGGYLIRALDRAGLRALLADKIEWSYASKNGTTPADPPPLVVDDLTSRADELIKLGMPVLDQIVHAPIFAPDGTLVTEPGYAPKARVWYEPIDDMVLEVPQEPTPAQRDAALRFITHDLLAEFPFVDKTDRAHALALLLLPFVRPMIDGPAPLHPIDAPTPGTGKGLLADVLQMPALGDVLPMTAELSDNDEMRKQLTTIFLAGYPSVLFDNVQRRVDSSALSAALTTRVWRGRILGVNRDANVPITQVFVMTGNNIDYSPEMGRRVAPIRLDVSRLPNVSSAIVEHPWRRSIERRQPLREWTREHRGELVSAALTIARSWVVADSPKWTGNPLGSFERWSLIMGGINQHIGGTGFLANLEEVYDRSISEREERCEFIQMWWRIYGDKPVTTEHLDALTLQPGVVDIFGLDGAASRARSMRIGHALKKMRDTVWCGLRIVKDGRNWRLDQLPSPVIPIGPDDDDT